MSRLNTLKVVQPAAMRRILPTLFVAFGLALSACAPLAEPSQPGAVPVIASFSVIDDLVRNVGGEHVAITTLAGPGVDTHSLNPTPADAAALAEAQLVFEVGSGFETWLDDLYAASGSRATRVVLTEDLALRTGSERLEAETQTGSADNSEYDPHVWHDVNNTIVMIQAIRDALVTADPAHRAEYEANAQAYAIQLAGLDQWIVGQVGAVPPEHRKLVTTHDTLAYFADRYGFEIMGSVLPTSTEGGSPSAQELAMLAEAVRAAGVPAVFGETVTSNSLISQVAREAGVQVVATLYTDSLGPEGSGAATYIDMMRSNVTTMVTALGS
jgi:ABC-type Zn uptake system ZnuABC Zn-binding protein ZnuA